MQKNLNQQLKILLRSSFFIFLIACATNFEKVDNKISLIDGTYGTSVNDYRLGLKYFDVYARDPTLNSDKLTKVIGELQKLKDIETDEQSKDLIQFRINLFEAEKLYKTASRKPGTSYDGPIRCSRSKEILESVEELKKSVENFENAVSLYETNNWNFMNDDWIDKARESDSIILTRANTQEKGIKKLCSTT